MEAEEAAMEDVKGEGAAPPPLMVSNMSAQPSRVQILLAISGILGPILFTIVWVVLGSIQPGYDHIAQLVSELGAVGAPNAILMNAVGFVPSGLLIVAFAVGLHRGMSGEKRSRIGPALLVLVGAGVAVAGIFPCDPGCVNESFTGIVHLQMSFLVFVVSGWLAPLVIARRVKEDARWQGYRRYFLATGAVLLGLVGIQLAFFMFQSPFVGLTQRLYLGILFLWIVVMAVQLLRLSLRPSAAGAPAG